MQASLSMSVRFYDRTGERNRFFSASNLILCSEIGIKLMKVTSSKFMGACVP